MSQKLSIDFSSEGEFLAHAEALEQELADRYVDMADSMRVHNNPTVAELFDRLADFGNTQAGELIRYTKGIELPQVAPWEYQWLKLDGPESCMQETHYLMTETQALQLAMRLERCAYDFYSLTAEQSADAKTLKIAVEMLHSKQKHLELMRDWLKRTSAELPNPPEDLDPPHIPE